MNKNIDEAFETIFNDTKLTEDLLRQDTPEKFYEFCSSVYGGYTQKELDEYIDNVMAELEEEDFNLKLNEDDLKNISGGSIKKIYTKLTASALASLVFMTPTALPNSYAAGETIAERRGNIMQATENKPKKSFWERHKRAIIKAGLFALAVAGTILYHKHKHPNGPINNPVENPASGGKDDEAELEDSETIVKNWWNSLVAKGRKNLPVLGKAALIPVGFYVLVDKLGNFSKKFNQTTGAYYTLQRMKETFDSWVKHKENIRNNRPVELRQSIDNIDNLFAEIKGQEKAKKEVKRLVINILHKKKSAEINGRKYAKGDVLYFYGPSRVGKSLMAEGLAKHKILSTSTEPYCVSASEVDKDSGKETVLDQLFGMSNYGGYGGYGGFDEYGGYYGGAALAQKPKNLVKYINDTPNGIVVIDEYDKMWSPALDEVFRTIVDKGVVTVKGQKIDCSGITFILTSNECAASVKGGNQYSGKDIDDGTGSRTFIKHDKSFLNRITPVEFENLNAASYEEIIRQEAEMDVIGYWARPEIAGLDVVITDEAYKAMAKSVERTNEGASHAHTLLTSLMAEITNRAMEGEMKQRDYLRGKKMFVDFNFDDDSFVLREESGDSGHSEAESDKSQEKETTKTDLSNDDENKERINQEENNSVSDDGYEHALPEEKDVYDNEQKIENDVVKKENNDSKQGVGGSEVVRLKPTEADKIVTPKKKTQTRTKKEVAKKPQKSVLSKKSQVKKNDVKPIAKKGK